MHPVYLWVYTTLSSFLLSNVLSDSFNDLQLLLEETEDDISNNTPTFMRVKGDDDGDDVPIIVPNIPNHLLHHMPLASQKQRHRRSTDTNSTDIDDNSNSTNNSGDDELRLVKYIFTSYNKEVRPVVNKNDAVQICFGLAYTQLLDLDEKNQVLVSNVWIRMTWFNHLLRWDKDKFGGIQSINIDPKIIWLPDIVLYNNAEETLGSGQMDQFKTKVIVNHKGLNKWYAPTILRSRCGINVEYFPFDDQKCELTFLSWTYDGYRVNITNKNVSADLKNYLSSGEFKLMSAKVYRKVETYSNAPYPQVTFTIHIRRKTLFYFNNLIVPCFLITALGLLTFVLPPATGERVTLVITTLLAMTVFMLMIAEKTPTTSKVTPLIGKFFIASMVIIGLSLIATCMVLNLYECSREIDSIPRIIRIVLLDYLSPFLRVDPPRARAIPPPPPAFADDNDEATNSHEETRLRETCWSFHKTNEVVTSSSDVRRRNIPTLPKEISEAIAILSERARLQDRQEVIAEEWQAVAKVADRLFLVVFLSIIAMTTVYIFVKRPQQTS